ncbi:ABC transporter permease [Vallitalea okinawensis]|uniref:ABC transporter permease n=1 Tax=Vallitalea okinawensis TaxID=2078660 RepID=UPI0013008424|nr:ABC transporter permease [Vallitalea okinawensis]
MINLMKLELRKIKLGSYIRGAIIATLVSFGLIYLIAYIEGDPIISNYEGLWNIIGSLSNATFMIFAGVLIGKIIIEEFQSKTIQVLFGYPIDRRRLMLAKISIVLLFTFISLIVSSIFLVLAFYILDIFYPMMQDQLTFELFSHILLGTVSYAIITSVMSLIPLYFGIRKKSVSTTIVTSVIIALFVNSNNNGVSLYSQFIIIPIILALLGAYLTYVAIMRNLENQDI